MNAPKPQIIRIGDVLEEQGIITSEQLQFALAEQRRTGLKLGRVLMDNNIVSDEQIATALAKLLNLSFVNLKAFNLKASAARLLPEILARRFRALVLEDRGEALLVGMVAPTDLFAYDELAKVLHRDLELAVITEDQFLHTVDMLYRKTEEISGLTRELEQEVGSTVVDFGLLAASPGLEEAPVVKLLQSIFEDAVQVRASDIHIEPQEGQLQVRFRIDGVLHLQTQADIKIASAVIVRLKLMSGLDISEKRLPQDGRFNVKLRQQVVDVRISTLPTQYGESVVMRLLSKKGSILELDSIGMPPPMLERYKRIISQPNGIVLVTGPTGSGKTTTLYATLAELNSPEYKIISVEDPVEYRLAGINQVQVLEKIDLSFARVLRAILRQDPDIVLVGEIRDGETAEIAMRAAMTGHLMLSTVHTNSAISTPTRLIDIGIPTYMLASSLLAIIAQRLVRLICDSCAEPYDPTPPHREWLAGELGNGKLEGHHLSHGRGCNQCNNTGYRGRIPVYEMLEVTPPVAAAIHHFDPLDFERIAREQMGNHNLRSHALELVLTGKTTIAEAMRISSQLED